MKLLELIRTKQFWKHVIIASVSGLALLYGGFLLLDVYTQHGEEVEVPDFEGIYIKDLEKFVEGHDLNFEIVDSVYSGESAKGTVVDQDPNSGSKVKKNRVIYLTVNAMLTKKVKMPDLIDLSLKQATSLLETYSLQVGMLHYVEGLPPVMEQSFRGKAVKGGDLIDIGSKIDLVLGRGNDGGLITIPNLLGLTLAEARFILASKSLLLGQVTEDDGIDTVYAKVWKQNPSIESGEGLYDGARVNIWITQSEALLEDAENNKDGENNEE
jgi:beta-lactam-binding protein with PASTA domain